jgi:hypothetical protein
MTLVIHREPLCFKHLNAKLIFLSRPVYFSFLDLDSVIPILFRICTNVFFSGRQLKPGCLEVLSAPSAETERKPTAAQSWIILIIIQAGEREN